MPVGPNEYAATVSVSQTNTSKGFGFEAEHVVVINDGASIAYFTLLGRDATTSDFPLKSGESLALGPLTGRATGIDLICATGQTATVRVGAWT